MAVVESFWETTSEPNLRQGEFMPRCPVPFVEGLPLAGEPPQSVPIRRYNLIVLTQSCDLEQQKVRLVSLCPIFPITRFEEINEEMKKKGRWEEVRKGRVEGLHLLNSPQNPTDNRASLVVDFREIYSLPLTLLVQLAQATGTRWCLRPPYLEHFSQAFARFYMRVGLPSAIAPFK